MAEEELKEVELDPGERELTRSPVGLTGAKVELEVPKAQDLPLLSAAPPEQGPQPGQQLGEREWFDQVIVGAGIETLDPVVHGVPGRQHEDRGVVLSSPHALADLQ